MSIFNPKKDEFEQAIDDYRLSMLAPQSKNVEIVQCYRTIELIENKDLKHFAEFFLKEDVPKQFFTASSSSSGKYHPPEDNGVGVGLPDILLKLFK